MPDFTMFTDYEAFKKLFGEDSAHNILTKAGRVIDNLTQEELIDLIHQHLNKYPQNTRRDDLIASAKRLVQTRFYEQLYKKKPSSDVLVRDEEFIKRLCLSDEYPSKKKVVKVLATTPATSSILITPSTTEKTTEKTEKPPKEKKPKKPKSELSQTIATMKLEEVITWATTLGVPQDRINQHKNKPLGLAKMNLGNLIRGKLNKAQGTLNATPLSQIN
jgi:hypothetical protein